MSPNPQQFTKYPNDIKAWREHLPISQWTVLTVIHEKLADWDKTSDAVSLSQIEAKTTMGRTTIQKALVAMESPDGPLVVTSRASRGIPIYSIRPCTMVKSTMVKSTMVESTMVESTMVSTSTMVKSTMVDAATMVDWTTTTDVHNTSKRVRSTLSLEGEQETGIPASLVPPPTSKETVEEDGLVEKTNSEKVDPASVCLDGSPTSQVLFKNSKTGKIWEIGQEVACISYHAKITQGEAEALLEDGNGMDVPSILALFRPKETWKKICESHNRVAYMRGIIQNHAPSLATEPILATEPEVAVNPLEVQTANNPAKPTEQNPTPFRSPLPTDDDDPDLGFGVDDPTDLGDLWPDESADQPAAANSMPVNQPAAVQEPESPAPAQAVAIEPIVNPYADPSWEAALKEPNRAHEDMPSMQARQAQERQAPFLAKLDQDRAQANTLELADVVEEPAAPVPAVRPATKLRRVGLDPVFDDDMSKLDREIAQLRRRGASPAPAVNQNDNRSD